MKNFFAIALVALTFALTFAVASAEESFHTQVGRMRNEVRVSQERVDSLAKRFYEKAAGPSLEREAFIFIDGMLAAARKMQIDVLISSFSAQPAHSVEYLRGQVDLLLLLNKKIEEEIVDILLKKED